jgi:hypothetical protein
LLPTPDHVVDEWRRDAAVVKGAYAPPCGRRPLTTALAPPYCFQVVRGGEPAHGGATVATGGSGGATNDWRHRSPDGSGGAPVVATLAPYSLS